MVSKTAISFEIDGYLVMRVEILPLPRSQPDTVHIGKLAGGKFHSLKNCPLKNMKGVFHPSLSVRTIDRGADRCGSHPLHPLRHIVVVFAVLLQA